MQALAACCGFALGFSFHQQANPALQDNKVPILTGDDIRQIREAAFQMRQLFLQRGDAVALPVLHFLALSLRRCPVRDVLGTVACLAPWSGFR